MNPWYESRVNAIRAARDGVAKVDTLHGPALGPTDYDRIDYPYAQVLPESTDRQGGNDFIHTIRLNCYFKRDRGADYLIALEAAMDAVSAAISELLDVDCVYNATVSTIEDFAGQLDDTALILISTQISVGTVIDEADAGER